MAHIFAYNGFPGRGGGAPAPRRTLLESSRRADVRLQFTRNAATYHFRDIRGPMAKM